MGVASCQPGLAGGEGGSCPVNKGSRDAMVASAVKSAAAAAPAALSKERLAGPVFNV